MSFFKKVIGLFGRKVNGTKDDSIRYAMVYNYVNVDAIDGKDMNDFYWEESDISKGLLADNVEIIFLEPGEHEVTAHGNTYARHPKTVKLLLEPDEFYILGAGPTGLYLEPYEG